MASLIQSLMLLVGLMAIMSVGAFVAAIFMHTRVGERILACTIGGMAGFIAYSLMFLSDGWVQHALHTEFLLIGRQILGLV